MAAKLSDATSYAVRIPPRLYEGLSRLADESYTTMSSLIRQFIEEGLLKRGVKLGK
jgi:predicted DNA-binding protein